MNNKFQIKRYWLCAPGETASKWEEFYQKGIIALGWSKLGDLTKYKSKDEIKKELQNQYGNATTHMNSALATWQFANVIKPGDVIFAKKGTGTLLGRGIVESAYQFDDEYDNYYPHCISVNWTHKGEWKYPEKAPVKTLTEITQYTELVDEINEMFDNEDETGISTNIEIETVLTTYTKKEFLEQVFLDDNEYETLVDLLKIKKNVILQGAPGVGKTYMAKRLAYSIMGVKDPERVMMVQFHQSYTYEDFIEGFRPVSDGNGFEIKKGSFYKFCRKAENDIDNDYFFIIDEINRGNLSKIFGELFMLIEKDKRGNELQLLYSDEKFCVPENVYIIGTMNTADRSLALLDYALRRRFAFYEMKPAFQSKGFKEYQRGLDNDQFNKLVDCVKSLNGAILRDESLGEGFCIGHSYLCEMDDIKGKTFSNIVEYEIIPLLREYWYDEPLKVKEWTDKLRGAIK